VDTEYREPSWRGVLITLTVTILAVGGLILLASYFIQQGCVPGAAQSGVVECVSPSVAPAPGDY